MIKKQPTIRDVAKLAEVSHQTVSRVINLSVGINPETRAKVEAAITQLSYRPNAIARSMAHGRTCILACISPNLTDYTFASLIEGAETEARQHGYFLLSASAANETTFQALVQQLVSDRRTDGLLVINPYADERHTHLPQNFPTVFLGARPRDEAITSVALDDVGAGQVATQHLLGLGHRRVALITGPLIEDCAQDRCVGYETALQAAGLSVDPAMMVEGDWSASTGYQALLKLARDGHLPTAVFAQNDRMAMGVLRAARDLGLKVPEQLAVIGIDDMPLAAYFDPPLTTLRQDMLQIGREAARLLLGIIRNPTAPPDHLRLPAELVIRSSTAPIVEGR